MDEFMRAKSVSDRVKRCGLPVLLVWVFLLMLTPGSAGALNTGTAIERRGVILAMNRPLDTEAEQLFKGVVAQSVRGGLERQKLGVIETSAPSFESTSFQNPAEYLDGAISEEFDFILLTEYASRGRELEIRMAWYDPQSGEKTEEVIRRGRKDLVLDRIIREALSELLRAVESSLQTLEPREFNQNTATEVNADFNPGGSGRNGHEVEGPNGQTPRISDGRLISPRIPDASRDQSGLDSQQERKRHFDIGVGCAPFVATGTASEYFKLGVMPVLNLSYLFQGSVSRFGIGLYAGMNIFTASGNLASAQTFLIPMGISLRYEIGSERYPSAVFGIASGPALLMMNASTDEQLLGMTFFGRGTLGVRLPLGKIFALLIEAGYDVYWEQPQPIMGFSPAVSTTVRL